MDRCVQAVVDINHSMLRLRECMKTIPMRIGGFNAEHKDLTRKVAAFTTLFLDASPLLTVTKSGGRKKRR